MGNVSRAPAEKIEILALVIVDLGMNQETGRGLVATCLQ
jgi:hypothetical protein